MPCPRCATTDWLREPMLCLDKGCSALAGEKHIVLLCERCELQWVAPFVEKVAA